MRSAIRAPRGARRATPPITSRSRYSPFNCSSSLVSYSSPVYEPCSRKLVRGVKVVLHAEPALLLRERRLLVAEHGPLHGDHDRRVGNVDQCTPSPISCARAGSCRSRTAWCAGRSAAAVGAEAAIDAVELALRPEDVVGEVAVEPHQAERAVVLEIERRADRGERAVVRILGRWCSSRLAVEAVRQGRPRRAALVVEDVRVVVLLDQDLAAQLVLLRSARGGRRATQDGDGQRG